MSFQDKMIKICQKIKNSSLEDQMTLVRGMNQIAVKVYPQELSDLLNQYDITKDLKLWHTYTKEVLENIDSYDIIPHEKKLILNTQNSLSYVLKDISIYTKNIDFKHEWEQFLITSHISSEDNYLAFQVYYALES